MTTADLDVRRRGPKKGTPRAPRMKRADREQQLLAVAERVFAERGYQDTTVELIAADAGITKPVIYDHFGSKENLLVAVVQRAREELLSAMAHTLSTMTPGSSTEDYFRAGVRTFMEFFERRRGSFQVYMQEAAVAAVAGQEIEDLRMAQASMIAATFTQIPGMVEYPESWRVAMAEIVIATNERIAGWRIRNPTIDLDSAVEIVMAVLWTGFAGHAPASAGPTART